MMYANGDGVQQNYTEAFNWFEKAADHRSYSL
ncbi:MAG: SEL1-like repeat protein [Endomicrobium sp.]|nr:SEL1-like repeat protein [Endomicrobium sp.]